MSEQPSNNSENSIQHRSESPEYSLPQTDPGFLGTLGDRIAVTFKLLFDKRVNIWSKLAVIASIGYIISPLDFIPDVLLPIGIADDVGVFGILLVILSLFIQIAPVDVVREHLSEMSSPLARQFAGGNNDAPDMQEEVIEGSAEYIDE